ncbi:MAG: protein kinase [Polyangiaceae bacterium]
MKPASAKSCPVCGERYEGDVLFCPKDGTPLASPRTASLSGAEGDPYVGIELAGQIRIKHLIGIGSMGRVYRAFQAGIERDVAVKILHRELSGNAELVGRFHREAKVASRLVHPNVVQVLMTGTVPSRADPRVGGEMYLVMEHLDGISLLSALAAAGNTGDTAALPLPRALHAVLQLCDAVGEAHAQGIVHRDLKPENVMLIRRGEDPDFVKVLDFGIARIDWANQSMATQAGLIFGTAKYISPEGAAGEGVGPPADVYSIATILYQCLAGRAPFEDESPVALLVQHTHAAPPELRSIPRASYVPAPIAEVIMQNLAKKPGMRAQDARAFGRDLVAAMRASGLDPEEIIAHSTLLVRGAVRLASQARTKSMDMTPELASVIAQASKARPLPAPPRPARPAPTLIDDGEGAPIGRPKAAMAAVGAQAPVSASGVVGAQGSAPVSGVVGALAPVSASGVVGAQGAGPVSTPASGAAPAPAGASAAPKTPIPKEAILVGVRPTDTMVVDASELIDVMPPPLPVPPPVDAGGHHAEASGAGDEGEVASSVPVAGAAPVGATPAPISASAAGSASATATPAPISASAAGSTSATATPAPVSAPPAGSMRAPTPAPVSAPLAGSMRAPTPIPVNAQGPVSARAEASAPVSAPAAGSAGVTATPAPTSAPAAVVLAPPRPSVPGAETQVQTAENTPEIAIPSAAREEAGQLAGAAVEEGRTSGPPPLPGIAPPPPSLQTLVEAPVPEAVSAPPPLAAEAGLGPVAPSRPGTTVVGPSPFDEEESAGGGLPARVSAASLPSADPAQAADPQRRSGGDSIDDAVKPAVAFQSTIPRLPPEATGNGRRRSGATRFLAILAIGAAAALSAVAFAQYLGRTPASEVEGSTEELIEQARECSRMRAWDSPPGANVKEITGRALEQSPKDPRVLDIRHDAAEKIVTEALGRKYAGHSDDAMRLAKLALELNPELTTAQHLVTEIEQEVAAAAASASATASETETPSEPAPATSATEDTTGTTAPVASNTTAPPKSTSKPSGPGGALPPGKGASSAVVPSKTSKPSTPPPTGTGAAVLPPTTNTGPWL